MAAPTNVRVEATSITTTMLRWTYSGSAGLEVHRSTDGSAYTVVASLASSETSYNDTGLSVATKYWYKLSDDAGSTFSSVVTVWTHSCTGDVGDPFGLIELPRFETGEFPSPVPIGPDGLPEGGIAFGSGQEPSFVPTEDPTVMKLNEMARRIESAFGDQPPPLDECIACPDDGAVIIDCSNGCVNWTVIADADINSVSINWCNKFDGNIEFIIPPNVISGICGFPQGFGLTGDECYQAPIAGGSTGKKVKVGYQAGGNIAQWAGTTPGTGKGIGPGVGTKDNRKSSSPGGGGTGSADGNTGSGGGGSGCTCVPTVDGGLTIKSCTANNSLSCTGSKKLDLIVCGGRGPYTWSKTGSVVLSRTTGNRITVTPPTNSGSAVSGKAYSKAVFGVGCGHSAGTTHAAGSTKASYNCDDSLNTCPDGAVANTATVLIFADSSCQCATHNGHAISGAGAITEVECSNIYATSAECTAAQAIGSVADHRTAGMISDGCSPCGLQEGATVSVTDALGTVATVIIRA